MNRSHVLRFDDYRHARVTASKLETCLDSIIEAHDKNTLCAIVINDMDLGALSKATVANISSFAIQHRIPLFVDPKRDLDKYEGITGCAILPNLKEWCHLTRQSEKEEFWRSGLDNSSRLQQMAQTSFRYLGNFETHIITCDKDGAVLILPHEDDTTKYSVYRVPPHPTVDGLSHQMGCGDVVTAAFALEFATSQTNNHTRRALDAYRVANRVAASFREMPWQCMPSRQVVLEDSRVAPEFQKTCEVSKGMLYLPKDSVISVPSVRSQIPTLLSADPRYRDGIDALLSSIGDQRHVRSLILEAPGGSGKTEVIKYVQIHIPQLGIGVEDLTSQFHDGRLDAIRAQISDVRRPTVFIVDEAFSGPSLEILSGDDSVRLLDIAGGIGARFLFVDADFSKNRGRLSQEQFLSRCDNHSLPGLADRPGDIPYIFASCVLQCAEERGITSVKIKSSTLLAVIEMNRNRSRQSD